MSLLNVQEQNNKLFKKDTFETVEVLKVTLQEPAHHAINIRLPERIDLTRAKKGHVHTRNKMQEKSFGAKTTRPT